MANFDRSGMTQAGINLMGKAVGGATIEFTRLVLGDGTMTGEISDLQGVVSPKQNVDVTRIERNDNQCTVGGELLTSSVKQGFFWREAGLYAMDPDVGEILYNYAYSTKPDFIAASDSGMMEEILVSMIATVGSNTNVDVTIDSSMVLTTKKEFVPLKNKVDEMFISIKEFGAVGNGIVDDTESIQNALKASKKVYIPEGIYKVTKQIKVYSNTTLEMHNEAVLINYILTGSTSVLSNYDLGEIVTAYNGESNIKISGGTILCTPNQEYRDIFLNKGDWGNQGITIAHGSNIAIENVRIQDVFRAHAIEITGCEDVTINNCLFDGWIGNPTYDIPGTETEAHREAVQIEDACVGASNANADGTQCKNIKIVNNKCKLVNSTYSAFPTAFGSHSNTDISEYIYIEGNEIVGCTRAGISYGNFIHGSISKNIIRACGRGIYSRLSKPMQDFIIKENVISDIEEVGIYINSHSKSITITENTIEECGGVGIGTNQNCFYMKIHNNNFKNCNTLSKDDCFARFYGMVESEIHDNTFLKDNSISIAFGVRMLETSEYPFINTRQYNNNVSFECDRFDIVVTPNQINNTDIIYSGDSFKVKDQSILELKKNPLKYKMLHVTFMFKELKSICIATSTTSNSISLINISNTGNTFEILECSISMSNESLKIIAPREVIMQDNTFTVRNVLESHGYYISKIEGFY